METRELAIENGILQYTPEEGGIRITGYKGESITLNIPERIEGLPVVCIGKKAFLSNKTLQQIELPEGVVEIDDWAFAFCSRLEKIILPYHGMKIGQGILKECHKLEQIVNELSKEAPKKREDIAFLLAATMSRLDAFYLFDFENAGKEDWLVQWDTLMMQRMKLEDTEGYSKTLLCGEEDYGSNENNLDYYIEQRRREKVRIAMLRLMHDYGLEEENRQELLAYIRAHAKGEASEETWLVVSQEHGDEKAYYQFLIDADCVNGENYHAMLEDLGEKHTEMKAFLMRSQAKEDGKMEEAFSAFEL